MIMLRNQRGSMSLHFMYGWVTTFCFCGSRGSLGKHRLTRFDSLFVKFHETVRTQATNIWPKNWKIERIFENYWRENAVHRVSLKLNTRCCFDSTRIKLRWDEWQVEWTPTSITGEFERRPQCHSISFGGLNVWNLSKIHWDSVEWCITNSIRSVLVYFQTTRTQTTN